MSHDNTQLSLGEFLRHERERRGIAIEQVASATKIGVKTLHHIEADHYVELPAKPFIRGFVSSYCKFVGLDPKEILTRYGDFIEARAQNRPNREGGHSGYAFEKREGEQSRTVLWIVMGSFLIIGILAAIFIKRPSRHHHQGSQVEKLNAAYKMGTPSPSPSVSPSSSPEPLASLAVPSPAPALVLSPAPTPIPEASPVVSPTAALVPGMAPDEEASPEDPLNSGLKLSPSEIKQRVVFKATESAWVRYQCDHRPVTQFVIRAGKSLVLRARESIVFQVSPPKAVTYSYKGSGFKPALGASRLVTRQNDATFFFPSELADSIAEPFGNEKPLSARTVPLPRASVSEAPSQP